MTLPRAIGTLILLILLAVLASLIAWLLTCAAGEEELDVGDPRVYHVRVLPPGDDGSGDGPKPEWSPRPEAKNVLFLGDGFDASQLETYHSVVYELAKGLVSHPPFCHYTDVLDFYRIDLDDPSTEFPQPDCPSGCASLDPIIAKLAAVQPGQIVRPGTAAVRVDLETTRCWTSPASTLSPACHVFWTGAVGQEKAYHLARFLTEEVIGIDIEVVVIVVNAMEYGGAGLYNVNMGIDRMLVVAVELDKPLRPGQEDATVSENTHLLFAHELGHALGLLDEYHVDGQPPGEPDLVRNIWRPAPSGVTGWPTAFSPIPWAPTLPSSCGPAQMVPCCANLLGESEYDPCDGLSGTNCYRVPGICQDPGWYCASDYFGPCEPPQNCDPADFRPSLLCTYPVCETWGTGAWEGAVYARKDYYRATNRCRMGDHLENEFCEACAYYLREKVFTSAQVASYRDTMERCPVVHP